jgi:hypothetical protein
MLTAEHLCIITLIAAMLRDLLLLPERSETSLTVYVIPWVGNCTEENSPVQHDLRHGDFCFCCML